MSDPSLHNRTSRLARAAAAVAASAAPAVAVEADAVMLSNARPPRLNPAP